MDILKNIFKKKNLDLEIESVEDSLTKLQPDSDKYTKIVKNLKELYEIKAGSRKWIISPEAILGGLVSIGCTLLVLNYEKEDTIISKAFNRKW